MLYRAVTLVGAVGKELVEAPAAAARPPHRRELVAAHLTGPDSVCRANLISPPATLVGDGAAVAGGQGFLFLAGSGEREEHFRVEADAGCLIAPVVVAYQRVGDGHVRRPHRTPPPPARSSRPRQR